MCESILSVIECVTAHVCDSTSACLHVVSVSGQKWEI